jgi:phenylpropionate dioxygenase-like ring-hydroxylating dioxygenase large terminal subunit
LPFEMGKLVNGRVQCGYHGLEFNKTGQCTLIPTQSQVPSSLAVRTYPVVERDGLVWIWTGEPERADASLVPDAGSIGLGAGWNHYNSGLSTIKCRFMLLIDNVMDLSHITFIHAKSIPASAAVVISDASVEEDQKSLLVKRRGRNLHPNPLSMALFPQHKGDVDQDFDAELYTPALVRLVGGFYSSATGERLGTYNVLNFITPETPTSVHNWGAACWNVELDSPAPGAFVKKMGDVVYREDVVALEAIEAGLPAQGSPREISVLVDAGSIQARRRIERLIEAEAASA